MLGSLSNRVAPLPGGRRQAGTTPGSRYVPVSSAARGLKPSFFTKDPDGAHARTHTHTPLWEDELCSSKISTLNPYPLTCPYMAVSGDTTFKEVIKVSQ